MGLGMCAFKLLMDVSIFTDRLRKIGASKEQARREQMAEDMANGGYDATQDDDDDMEF